MTAFKMKLPREVSYVLDLLHRNSGQAYVVGGCVRDAYSNRTPHDYDVCTNMLPNKVSELFTSCNHTVIPTGIAHGTVTVLIDDSPIEITTYRVEGNYSDSRHPDSVEFVSDLQQDLSRRDFTMNAMAYNEEEGLVDPFNGRADIENQILRCVGDPEKRFSEDALRILRAIRFCCCYNYEATAETILAMKNQSYLLANISIERIISEFTRALCSEHPILLFLFQEVIHRLFAILSHRFGDNGFCQLNQSNLTSSAALAWSKFMTDISIIRPDPHIRWAIWMTHMHNDVSTTQVQHLTAHQYREILSSWKMSKKDSNLIAELAELIQHRGCINCYFPMEFPMEALRLLHAYMEDTQDLTNMERFNKYVLLPHFYGVPFRISDLPITGDDLINIGYRGAAIGAELNELLRRCLAGNVVPTKEQLYDWAAKDIEYDPIKDTISNFRTALA